MAKFILKRDYELDTGLVLQLGHVNAVAQARVVFPGHGGAACFYMTLDELADLADVADEALDDIENGRFTA